MKPRSLFLSFALFLGMSALRADDLDVTGNVITFGELTGNSSLAGATLQFQDLINAGSSYTANLYSMLAREQAQWQWLRAADSSGETTLPVMILDTLGRLNLYDPATAGASPAVPTIILAPGVQGGVQTSKLPRLELSNQTLDTDNSVITKILGDARYLLAPGANQGLELTSGINVNTGGTGSSNTVPANAAAIGQNLQVSSGQVVVGRNNTAANTEVFVVGAGATSSQTMNALSISDTGDTTIGGDLTVAGEAVFTDATVSGTLTVEGSPVLTQVDAASFASQAALASTAASLSTLATSLPDTYVQKSATALAIGTNVTANSNGGVAFGTSTAANGGGSFTLGQDSTANGLWSMAMGYNTSTNANHAIAAGYWTTADGVASVALGQWAYTAKEAAVALGGPNICAKGANSFAAGSWSTAWGDRSAALGYGLWVTLPNLVILGTWNDSTRADLPQDLVFVVGNGLEPPESDPYGKYTPNTNPNQSNAIEVQLSGRTTIRNKSYQTDATAEALNVLGSASVSGNLTVAGSPVLTQAAANTTFATQAAVTSQFATLNTQLSTTYVEKSANGLALGVDALADGGGWAVGYQSLAGPSAVSIGNFSGNNGWYHEDGSIYKASGEASVSVGYGSHGLGPHSVAVGFWNWAQGDDSVSLGYVSEARSDCSVAIGKMAVANRWGQIVVGSFNELSTSSGDSGWATNSPLPTDDLFIVGNGTSDEARSNALVIKRNGDVSIFGTLTVAQPSRVQAGFIVEGQADPADASNRTVIAKPNQEVLVPEQGDISMGEFRSGSLPLTAP